MLEPGPAGRVKFQQVQVQVPGMAAGGTGRALGLGQEAASARQEGFSSILHEELDLYSEGKESFELGSDRIKAVFVEQSGWALGPAEDSLEQSKTSAVRRRRGAGPQGKSLRV